MTREQPPAIQENDLRILKPIPLYSTLSFGFLPFSSPLSKPKRKPAPIPQIHITASNSTRSESYSPRSEKRGMADVFALRNHQAKNGKHSHFHRPGEKFG